MFTYSEEGYGCGGKDRQRNSYIRQSAAQVSGCLLNSMEFVSYGFHMFRAEYATKWERYFIPFPNGRDISV